MCLPVSNFNRCIPTGANCHRMVASCTQMGNICSQTVALLFIVTATGQLYIAPGWLHIATMWVHSATGQVYVLYPQPSPFSLSFAVHHFDGVDDQGHVITVTHSLVPDSVTLAPGYDAMREDPDIYKTMDFCGYAASRQFPDIALPMSPAQQQP